MKTTKKITAKKEYCCPEIDCITLDNNISLALESNPPLGPGELVQSIQVEQNNPYKAPIV